MDITTLAQKVNQLHAAAEARNEAEERTAELRSDGAAEHICDQAETDFERTVDRHACIIGQVLYGLAELFPWITNVGEDFASDMLFIDGCPRGDDAQAWSRIEALSAAFAQDNPARHTLCFEDLPTREHLLFFL